MNKCRITYPNNKEVRDDTSRTTKISTNSSMHYKYWTEILANNFAKKYFTYDYALSKYFPQGNVKLPWSLVVLSLIR